MLTSKINVCAFRETEILNNVSERSNFILVFFGLSRSVRCRQTVHVRIVKTDHIPRSRLCHEPLRVALDSDPSPEPEMSQGPTMRPCVCSELQ